MKHAVDLALGTAQFGMAYGVAGRGDAVPLREARKILEFAWQRGIRVLDTAPSYGDIEAQLDSAAGRHGFSVVSKIPALPEQAGPMPVALFVRESIRESRARLGSRLGTLLFHRGADLLGPQGRVAWEVAGEEAGKAGLRLGISCYSPEEALAIRASYPIEVAQMPGNALDQRLNTAARGLEDVEIHVRSVFLQGLLLLAPESAAARVPASAAPLAAWAQWREEKRIGAVGAALGIARSLPGVRYCVVGVDRLSQLEEIVDAWDVTGPLHAAMLATNDGDVIDPRRWAARS